MTVYYLYKTLKCDWERNDIFIDLFTIYLQYLFKNWSIFNNEAALTNSRLEGLNYMTNVIDGGGGNTPENYTLYVSPSIYINLQAVGAKVCISVSSYPVFNSFRAWDSYLI